MEICTLLTVPRPSKTSIKLRVSVTEYEEDAEVDVAAEDGKAEDEAEDEDEAEAEDEAEDEDVALLLPFVPLLRDEAEFTAKLSSSFWPINPPLNWVSLGSFLRASVTASGQRQHMKGLD